MPLNEQKTANTLEVRKKLSVLFAWHFIILIQPVVEGLVAVVGNHVVARANRVADAGVGGRQTAAAVGGGLCGLLVEVDGGEGGVVHEAGRRTSEQARQQLHFQIKFSLHNLDIGLIKRIGC